MGLIKKDHYLAAHENDQAMDQKDAVRLQRIYKLLTKKRQAAYDVQRDVMNGWYDQLGWVGSQFKKAFTRAACVELVDSQDPDVRLPSGTRAVMNGYHVKYGFQNLIRLGNAVLNDEDSLALFSARNHELTHLAFQYQNIAAAHATPWNSNARVILCPRDTMILNVLMERQAFAVQLLLDDMARKVDSGELTVKTMPSREDTQKQLRAYTKNMDWHVKWDSDQDFVRHYRKQAQGFFAGVHAKYLKTSDITYARLGLDDLRQINDFMGLKTFADNDEDLLKLLDETFEEFQLKLLDEQNADLKVGVYKQLPTVTDALAARNTRPKAFIRDGLGIFAPAEAEEIEIKTVAGQQPSAPQVTAHPVGPSPELI